MLFLIGGFLLLIVIGFPIVFSLALISFFYLLAFDIPVITMAQKMVSGIDSYALLAVPFFILAGNLMNNGGVTQRLFRFASSLVGWIPGGLGHANVVASMIFAGMSGAAIADAGGLGTIEIKAMKDEGFDIDFAAGVTAASSTIGPIIPPSIPMVIYASIANVSVGKLFLAGALPGLLMGLALMILIFIIAEMRKYPVHSRFDIREAGNAFAEGFLPLITPGIILGGILGGVFSPTEAAIVASTYALILGMFVYKEIKFSDLYHIIMETVKTTSMVIYIISAASIYGFLLGREQVPQSVGTFLFTISQTPAVIIFIIIVFLLIIGCFLETTASLILLTPILVPPILQLGLDPVHFGVLMVLTLMIGLITPPVGVVLYITSNIARISFEKTMKATLPFLVPLVIVLLCVAYWPEMVMFLPNLLIK
ncbi:ABC transporter permease [Marispirochaeta aestuarii]|uniref:ABC transporter permease n=1 Tax=Marispirochaeta aestuarii TaxID=1963862 RepID=A0A1Y1S112_9SPIO|nr:TRAP transporter large permease [Marispirochaeta aestuarii]ORC36208.1 ABC transporter permease [Marispirochaeta aestuarii]